MINRLFPLKCSVLQLEGAMSFYIYHRNAPKLYQNRFLYKEKKKTEIISLNNEKRNLLSQLLSTGHVVLKLESICPSRQAAHWISIRTLDTWTMLKGLAVRTYSVQSVQFLENPDNFRVHLNSC